MAKALLVAFCRMDSNGLKIALGKRISKIRNSQGLSQDKLCMMVGLGHTYLVDVENGRRNIGFENLCKIAGGLGVTVSELTDIDDFDRLVSGSHDVSSKQRL